MYRVSEPLVERGTAGRASSDRERGSVSVRGARVGEHGVARGLEPRDAHKHCVARVGATNASYITVSSAAAGAAALREPPLSLA